jgi:hypothetical protein
VNAGLTDNYLKIRGIEATLKLAESNNAKVVIIGSPPIGLPIVLSGDSVTPAATPSPAPTGAGGSRASGPAGGGPASGAPAASGPGGGPAPQNAAPK